MRLREFAVCDGPLSADEDDALKVIEVLLQVSPAARKAQKRSWKQRRMSARVERPRPQRSHWSYEYLGCTERDTDEVIKRAYRKLALKLHPDKHASHALSPEETLYHLRAFQKLQQAYEAVWRLREGAASS